MLLSPRNPPPVPVTEPPPLPSSVAKRNDNSQANDIKKALLDNMKCVENWKIEQELLMKVKLNLFAEAF
jgi:hypothetical protein